LLDAVRVRTKVGIARLNIGEELEHVLLDKQEGAHIVPWIFRVLRMQ
jgi:hypothetical protein